RWRRFPAGGEGRAAPPPRTAPPPSSGPATSLRGPRARSSSPGAACPILAPQTKIAPALGGHYFSTAFRPGRLSEQDHQAGGRALDAVPPLERDRVERSGDGVHGYDSSVRKLEARDAFGHPLRLADRRLD